ncbi:MAG: glycosyltransferase family 39 protein [Crocinitomicaceae bacterium]|nr:glycosyltransferase family 39 protein [Crocinitomicaceae bacterium]
MRAALNIFLSEKNLFISGAIALFLAAYFSKGYYHPDEHFQILEFAHYKLSHAPASELAWEFHAKIRPTTQPMIAAIFMKVLNTLGLQNPFLISFILRLFAASLSFLGIFLFYRTFKEEIKSQKLRIYFLLLTFFTWFILFNSVRFSSEGLGTSFILIAISLLFKLKEKNGLHFIYIGSIFGLSFLMRFQIGFLLFGLFLWLLIFKKLSFTQWLGLGIGVLTLIGLGICIDSWFYGEYTLTIWNYFESNIIDGKASSFGESPWWWYFTEFLGSAVPPYSFILLVGSLYFVIWNWKHPIAFMFVFFLLGHIVVAHKELRFLFPIAPFLPFMTLISLEHFNAKKNFQLMTQPVVRFIVITGLVVNFVLTLVVCFRPTDPHTVMFENIWNNYKEPVKIYYFQNNPYHRPYTLNFYKRPDLIPVKANSVSEIQLNSDTTQLVLVHFQERDSLKNLDGKFVYMTYPEWVLQYNFNDWLSRSYVYYIVELPSASTTK